MDYQKTQHVVQRFLQSLFWPAKFAFIILSVWLIIIQSDPALAAHRDCFYFPNVTGTISVDGNGTETAWQNSNQFTFGTQGHPEAIVFGHQVGNYLYLLFHVNDNTLTIYDKLTICIDPIDAGGTDPSTVIFRYDFFPSNKQVLYYTWNGTWQSATTPPFALTSDASWYSTYCYWEVEIKINCISSYAFSQTDFGIHFQVLDNDDLTQPGKFTPYRWPQVDKVGYDPLPIANWGNGCFLIPPPPYTGIKPDLYFNLTDIMTLNLNQCEIYLGRENTFRTTNRNRFFPYSSGTTTPISHVFQLQLKYADFGAGNPFSPINSENCTSITPNQPLVKEFKWTPTGTAVKPVILRGEVFYTTEVDKDAITCNNIRDRDMQYVRIKEDSIFVVSATITNPAAASAIGNPVTLLPLPQLQDTLYFFIDRSGLDPSVPDSLWDIRFNPESKQDTLLPIGVDHYKMAFPIGEKKQFKTHFIGPPVKPHFPSFPWDWLKCSNFKDSPPSQQPSISAMSSNDRSLTQSASPRSTTETFQLPSDNRSTLLFKVYKEKAAFVVDGETFHQLETVGYFGFEIKVISKYEPWWLIVLVILVIAIIIYWIIKKWFKPGNGFWPVKPKSN